MIPQISVVHISPSPSVRPSTARASSPRCWAPRAAWTSKRWRTVTSAPCFPSPGSVPTTCTRWSTACSTRRPCRSCTPGGPHIVTALGRFGGRTVSVVANNPLRLGGCLDSLSAEKSIALRPDVRRRRRAAGRPGRRARLSPRRGPGVGRRRPSRRVVPRITLVTRKTYGGAYIAMNARSLGATKVFAWPGAEVAVMGSVAAIRVLHRRRLPEVSPRSGHRSRPSSPQSTSSSGSSQSRV